MFLLEIFTHIEDMAKHDSLMPFKVCSLVFDGELGVVFSESLAVTLHGVHLVVELCA